MWPIGSNGATNYTAFGYMWANGVKLFDDNWNVVFDSPEIAAKVGEYLDFMMELTKYMPPAPVQAGWANLVGDFQTDKISHTPGTGRLIDTMNVRMPPFDNVLVRKAVNMAINKDRIVRIINGRAVPANQPLPPTMPGYVEDYEGYAFDPDKAKALLADAGLADGFETEMYVMNTDPNPRIAQAIQQDLAAIGIKVDIKSLAQANVIDAGGNGTAPMIWLA